MNNHLTRRYGSNRLIDLRLFLIISLLISWLAPQTAAAAIGLDGSSRSYLQIRESNSENRLLPGYEYLNLSAGDPERDISFHFGGWARYDFKQEDAKSDLQFAYISYRRKTDNTSIDLGRVLVFEGVAQAERVDGGYARTDLAGNFSISAFGGVPAEIGLDVPGNSVIYGGRLAQQMPDLYRIGVSALREEKNDEDFRKEAGIDLWVRPIAAVELTGRSTYDDVSRAWMEHSYYLTIVPAERLRFATEGSLYRYESLFRTVTTPALQFNAGLLDPNETATVLGEEATYTANNLLFAANVRYYGYKIAGNALSYGGRINYGHGTGNAAGLAVNRTDGDDERLQYTEFRLYGSHRMGKATVAADLLDREYDQQIAGEDRAYSASVIAAYDLTQSLRVGADVEYLKSPYLDNEVRAFIKILYTFGSKFVGGV